VSQAPKPASSAPLSLRSIGRELQGADDARLHRVVAMLDSLPDRGDADALLHPLRPRLAVLRPQRRLSFTRLLFAPVEPLIVPARAWTPGRPAVPRPALRPLAHLVRAALGAEAAAIDRLVASRTTADQACFRDVGATLWPAAAATLAEAPPPADWHAASGLRAEFYAPIARPLAVLLAEGQALQALALAGEDTATVEPERLLRSTATAVPEALAMMLALLLTLVPQARGLVLIADDLAAQRTDEGRSAPDRALDFLLAGVDVPARDEIGAGQLAEQTRRALLLLDEVQAEAEATQRKGRLARVTAARRRLDATCRARFQAAAAKLTLAPAPAASASPPSAVADAEIGAAEASARDLQRLNLVGRRLGDAAGYDRSLRSAATRLAQDPRLTRMDRLRLVEILLGPEAALAILGRG
jgi:hypothetical protein